MRVQLTNIKSQSSIKPCAVIYFGGTVSPSTVAEQVQRALRDLYHDAICDGITREKNIIPRINVVKDALISIFKKTEHKETVAMNGHIIFKLVQFYNNAFRNGVSRKELGGWANATMTRRQIADCLESEGFKYTANELRQNVNDNLRGDY